jgi:demethylmenaquinone methyltransferase / 2-methoxy-6-polyprenyl-1,4-benzoquinol methylase
LNSFWSKRERIAMSFSTPPPTLQARFASAGGKPTYVRQMFGRIARVYDLMNRLMTVGLDRRWRAFAARQLALTEGGCALDVGTGTGDLAIVAAQMYPHAQVVGVDFTPEMLERGREKLERLNLSERVRLQVGDGARLDFPDDTFDACCSAFVARNLADLPGGLAEMRRMVKPGGRIVCLEISHPRNKLFSGAFHLYFDRLVPLLGRVVGRSFDAYSYLPTSVSAFPDAPTLQRVMTDTGWDDVRYFALSGGIVAVHVGTKPLP